MTKQYQNPIISNNADFLFIYDATLCNPNGDPDRENKPRMDDSTKTNLVTDTRVKRYIRDYLKMKGVEIFIDMEGNNKVSVDTRLLNIVYQYLDSDEFSQLSEENEVKIFWAILKEKVSLKKNEGQEENDNEGHKNVEQKVQMKNSEFYKLASKILKTPKSKLENLKDYKSDVENHFPKFNDSLLFHFVKNKYIDIRMFGSAVAVSGFPRTVTGPIQLNWGYSLNEVELVESNSIVTIMAEGSSTFGKDYRVHYSLLAFHGTINKFAGATTELRKKDVVTFRDAIWNSISSLPTRSKINQYPKVYLEIIYNDGYGNGHFGDLRNLIKVETKDIMENGKKKKFEARKVRKLSDLNLDFSKLIEIVSENIGEGENKPIKDYELKYSPDLADYFSTLKPNS